MKTTDMTAREIATAKRAHAEMMDKLRQGLRYDIVRRAWVKPEDLTIKNPDE